MKSSRATDATQACRRSHHGSAHFVARIPGRPCLVELREPATADSTSNTPTRTGCRGAPLPPPMELSVRMHVLTMVGNSVVISASATKVSGIEERRVSVLRAVWLSKCGPPCRSFGAPLWSFAFVVRCLPFFNTPRRPFKQNGGGRVSAAVLVVILCFCRYFCRPGWLLVEFFYESTPPKRRRLGINFVT